MTNFQDYCDNFYSKTGLKFHWYLKSCCLDISSFNETSSFNSFKSSSTLNDADIIVIGAKLGQVDIEKFQKIINIEQKKIVLFGNCAFDGGIFSVAKKNPSFLSQKNSSTLFIPGCPPSFSQFTSFFENFIKGQM